MFPLAGLAVAEEGRKVYIVGGRFGLIYCNYDSIGTALDCYTTRTDNLLADIRELDLGGEPMKDWSQVNNRVAFGSAHWRKVWTLWSWLPRILL